MEKFFLVSFLWFLLVFFWFIFVLVSFSGVFFLFFFFCISTANPIFLGLKYFCSRLFFYNGFLPIFPSCIRGLVLFFSKFLFLVLQTSGGFFSLKVLLFVTY